jgi:hypothetical protein
MRKLVVTILIVLAGLPLMAQEEVHLPPAVIPTGGLTVGSSAEGSTSLTSWRLSMVHIITLSEDLSEEESNIIPEESELDWKARLYPNPVDESLFVDFELPEARDFIIKLTDINGRVLVLQKTRTIYPDEIIEVNMSEFSPAMYLLHITTSDQKTHKIYRAQKI